MSGAPTTTDSSIPPAAAALTTAAFLCAAELATPRPLLLLERFLPGFWWMEVILLSVYAAALTRAMATPAGARRWRPRLWRLFSAVFFAQLALGLAGVERCLMTGTLHLPVPALILAGPLYRGGGLFMPILFGVTALLAGPAWCSHLCYLGAWDDVAARRRRLPATAPRWRRAARLAMLAGVVAAALLLRRFGVPALTAGFLALGFLAVGLVIMATLSRRSGVMLHCTLWCPIGLLADVLGKLNPFRVRFGAGCASCGACSRSCRYAALQTEHIAARKVGIACTLCGDCLSACPHGQLAYHFPGLSPHAARTAFVVLIVSLHAVFLGLARI